jgi:hypothetical protein
MCAKRRNNRQSDSEDCAGCPSPRQPVRLLQDVPVFRLLPREEADGHKQRAEHQPHQHDPAVGVFVGGVE